MKLTDTPKVPDAFDDFNAQVAANAKAMTGPRFRSVVAAAQTYPTYLAAMPEHMKQEHTCHCCQAFLTSYGGVYTIQDGEVKTLWSGVTGPYAEVASALDKLVRQSAGRNDGLALIEPVTGSGPTGQFTHFHMPMVPQGKAKVHHYADAIHRMNTTLGLWKVETVAKFVEMLEMGIYRAASVVDQAKFQLRFHQASSLERRRMVADAHDGLTHPRSGMLGMICDLIEEQGLTEFVKRRFESEMSPYRYQRTSAPVTDNQIEVANKFVQDNNLASALERRFARHDEIPDSVKIWVDLVAPNSTKVFDHLRKTDHATAPVKQTMTWDLFVRTVLPNVSRMRAEGHVAWLTTAVHPDAAVMLAHDSLEHRNPVSWYMNRTFLTGQVECVTSNPTQWGVPVKDEFGPFLILKDMHRTSLRHDGLFNELLHHSVRPIRRLLEENNAQRKRVEGEAVAAVRLGRGSPATLTCLMKSGSTYEITIDRLI